MGEMDAAMKAADTVMEILRDNEYIDHHEVLRLIRDAVAERDREWLLCCTEDGHFHSVRNGTPHCRAYKFAIESEREACARTIKWKAQTIGIMQLYQDGQARDAAEALVAAICDRGSGEVGEMGAEKRAEKLRSKACPGGDKHAGIHRDQIECRTCVAAEIRAAVAEEREKCMAQVAHLRSNLDALGAHAEVARAADVKAAVAEERAKCETEFDKIVEAAEDMVGAGCENYCASKFEQPGPCDCGIVRLTQALANVKRSGDG